MSPAVTQEHLEARKLQVLKGAVRAFARDGLSSVTMQAIAEEAGVAVGTLYLHFENKAAVLQALGETSATAGRELLRSLEGREDALGALQDLLRRLVMMAETPEGTANTRVDVALRSEALRDDRLRELVRTAHDEWQASFAGALREAIEMGIVRPEVEPDSVATVLVSLLTGVSAVSALDPDYPAARASAAISALLDGLRR